MGGLLSTVISLFCGYMIIPSEFPDFWIFMYWLNPLHYALEGLLSTQFHRDETKVLLFNGAVVPAWKFAEDTFPDWNYDHRVGDAMALVSCIVLLR
jgi:hypothetical protein